METLLNRFCASFDEAIRPVLAPFSRCADRLAEARGVTTAERLRADVNNLAHHLAVVADKVAAQQAYVLIFGPLKSGKSTLMNAMCAAYVSEVTSLPAYPCMVYVSHAETAEVVITHYDNSEARVDDPAALRGRLDAAHRSLADEIRRVEAAGGSFEVHTDYPAAIRRVDYRLPAGDLAESGAVLVDTPGLYTRMRFGYDQMTRDFRDTAACAIFVVKSENLFLEQVFDEFTDLLDLFTRVFLVVNLDTTRMDLRPDGSVAPALEAADPARIIEAFENLAMSAPLKTAVDEGRLRIFPVDLLNAGRRRLAPAGDDASGDDPTGFGAFFTTLTDYLNSDDYLRAFLGDSIRRARRLLDEAATIGERDDVAALATEAERLRHERAGLRERATRLGRLRDFDWRNAVNALWRELDGAIRAQGEALRKGTAAAVSRAVDDWFGDDASLLALNDDVLAPRIEETRRAVLDAVRDVLLERIGDRAAGLTVGDAVRDALEREGIDLGRAAVAAVEEAAGRTAFAPHEAIVPAQRVPVRRRMIDWVLLRSAAQVRRALLGESDRPSNRVSPALKASRLDRDARAAMRTAAGGFVDTAIPAAVATATKAAFDPVAAAVQATLEGRVDRDRASCAERIAEIDTRLGRIGPVLDAIAALRTAVGETDARLESVADRYARTTPEALRGPVAPDA